MSEVTTAVLYIAVFWINCRRSVRSRLNRHLNQEDERSVGPNGTDEIRAVYKAEVAESDGLKR
jgi:hypothetical protein